MTAPGTDNGRIGLGKRAAVASVAVVAAGLLACALAPVAGAAKPTGGTLSDPSQQIRWQGEHFANTLEPPLPEACGVIACDEFHLRVRLPAGTWSRPGGVLVSIRWHDIPEAQDLDLYVYGPDGSQVAKSDGFFASNGEGAEVKRPRNGLYRVVVVPKNTTDQGLDYRGVAHVIRPPARNPVRRLLPNLQALAPRHLHFQLGAYLFDPASQLPAAEEPPVAQLESTTNCYPEEMIELGASRCLRFDQVIANFGQGPFELRLRMQSAATDKRINQRIYRTDGSHYDHLAGAYELHPAHAHFHYKDFAQSKLWKATADGRRTGTRPVRVGKKNGFCMIDVDNKWFGLRSDHPRAYYFPRCNSPTESDSTGTYMVNGISPGWADVYNWYLADQFVDIAGVRDGCYVLETIADPKHTVVESDYADNAAFSLIVIKGDSAHVVPRSHARSACA